MMAQSTINLIAAPVGMQPGRYLPGAYANQTLPHTKQAQFESTRSGNQWRFTLLWEAPEPTANPAGDPQWFPDAAALICPETAAANWITMGSEGNAVSGVLWRADKQEPLAVRAEGIGSMTRSAAPNYWQASAQWQNGFWAVLFTLEPWEALERDPRLAFAIWQGSIQQRGGLKSVTPDWIRIA
jgi:DMSO reductase family type II enzyme heme b subunit